MKRFTRLYPLSKTLRFELKPIGKTLSFIEKHGLLEQDKHRADSYKKVKKIIDRYHKWFIEKALNNFKLKYESTGNSDSLKEYHEYYILPNRTEDQKKTFEKIQGNLRKQIAEKLKNEPEYKRIYKKELIKEDLLNFVTDDSEKELIGEFLKFTTYFAGFHENRKNMYSAEDKSTAIAYRVIHENLPKFIDNISTFSKLAVSPIADKFQKLYKALEEYLNVKSIAEMFELEYFSMVLTQTQIDVYNTVIGGISIDDNTKIQGLNEYINLYNQKQKDKSARLPKLKPLFKQILSDRNIKSWLPETFESDNDLIEKVKQCYKSFRDETSLFERLRLLLLSIQDYDLDNIYIRNDLQLTNISQKIFGQYDVIEKALLAELRTTESKKKKELEDEYVERIKKILKNRDSISIGEINLALKKMDVEEYHKSICDYFMFFEIKDNNTKETIDIFRNIEKAYSDAEILLDAKYTNDKKLAQDKVAVEKIKNLLDALKNLQNFVKPLCGKGNEAEKDEKFYGEFTPIWEELNMITPLYNMVRNHLTKKPYSVEKIKLNFENNGSLLKGWVDSKTDLSDNGTQYGGYLFRKKNSINEYDYYLGISSDSNLFRKNTIIEESDISDFERLDYYQLKSETFYGSAYKGDYELESEKIIEAIDSFIEKYCDETIKSKIDKDRKTEKPKTKTAKGYLTFLSKEEGDIYNNLIDDVIFKDANLNLINSIKKTLLSFERIPNAKLIAEKKFTLFDELMKGVENLVKEKGFSYIPISKSEFEFVLERENKKLYLFKISNKDLSYAETYEKGLRHSRGRENLHTMYFKALMSGNQNVFDIGSGAIYFREKGIEYDKPTHPANVPIENKNPLNKKKNSTFDYDLIKDKRYTVDKFQFHLSVTLNFKSTGSDNINQKVNEYIQKANDLHVIGIDRGERHLLYLTVVDMKGVIKEQFSLNEIVNEYKGNTYKVNYHDLLERREKERDEERKSWKTIENIKELKEGYLSQVIHKITTLMIKYNAIVVLEDLNFEFMRGRLKVEKSVYQKFEKMLIDKLNYLADKSKDIEDEGGVLNAYQLTNKFVSFQKMGKQTGFLFYTQAWNTSKIDPTTGFVNLFDTRYENISKAKAFFEKFDDIRYNAEKDWFEFEFDYNKFTTKAEGTKTRWTICTFGNRIETFRNVDKNSQWDSRDINLSEKFKAFFKLHCIDINSNLKQTIVEQDKKDFFEGLLHLLKLTLQIRNSHTGTTVDYMQSPVMNSNGKFYNSNDCDITLPQNADANGAYNIARKGIMIVNRIKETEDLKKLKLAISNKEWLEFAQQQNNQ